MEQKLSFDRVAALYDRARPTYPDALIGDVLSFSGVVVGARALEIGCGTGKASVAFAERGLSLDCLEPGPAMAALARENLAGFHDVRVHETSFESWPIEDAAFDLVFSAQAFHWLDPAVRLVKTAQALRPGGTLAIFWNTPKPGAGALHDEIRTAYARWAPGLAEGAPGTGRQDEVAPPADEVMASSHYGPVTARAHCWRRAYTAEAYTELMQTQSNHILLPEQERARLLDAVHAAIVDHGGEIGVEYVARLFMAARVAESAP